MKYLLDTNILSETRKKLPDERVLRFLAAADANALFVSVLSLGELHKGAAMKRRKDPIVADRLAEWIGEIEETFVDRILPLDSAAARLWGDMSGLHTLPVVDALIAATALARDLTVVTRNTRDMEKTGALLVDPFR